MTNATTTTATKTITVDGIRRPILNSHSSGPGCTPHTYFVSGAVITSFGVAGGEWSFHANGQFPRPCAVAFD